MRQEHWITGEGTNRRMVVQHTEGILGGQFNEDGMTRLEVALIASRGETRLELRLLGWGKGIDWYMQKSLQLDRHQTRALKQILGRGGTLMTSAAPKLRMIRRADQQRWNNPQAQRGTLCA